MIRYLTGVARPEVEGDPRIGLMIQPGNSYHRLLDRYPFWAADNGAFSRTGGFDAERYEVMLTSPGALAARSTCLFVAVPDVLCVRDDGTVVGDAEATLLQYGPWALAVRSLGYPTAFVAQDGCEDLLTELPWALIDCMFLGGSTEWKLSRGARACVTFARALGLHTHMGRVNSRKRLHLAEAWGCDTADGTFLKYGGAQNVPRLRQWFEGLEDTCGSI